MVDCSPTNHCQGKLSNIWCAPPWMRSLVWFALANHQTYSVHPPLMRQTWTTGGGIGADGATDLRPCWVLQISRWCWQGPPCAPVLRAGDTAISQHDPHKRVVPPLTAQCDTALISAALAGEPRCCSAGESKCQKRDGTRERGNGKGAVTTGTMGKNRVGRWIRGLRRSR